MQVKLKSKTLIEAIGYEIITEDMLNKLEELKIVGDNSKISSEEAILIIDDLQQLFEKLPNVTKVSLSNIDMSNINISEILKYCPTSDITFDGSDKYFNRMKKKIALLRNTTKEKLGLSGKKIISEYDVFKAIKSYGSQTKIIVEAPDINVIKKYIDSIDKLYINLIEDSEVDKLINILNKDNEKEKFVKIEELKRGELPSDKEVELYVFIENLTELTLDDLKRYEELYNIKGVILLYKSEKSRIGYRQIYANDYYDIETYKKIRQEIDEIVKSINPDISEEYKFLELYKKLAEKISYDCEHEDDAIWEKSHSLEGGLLNNTCICEGYAKILVQICRCLGIEAKFIYGDLHAWNQVKLNGNWYNADLTFDRDNIVENRELDYCMQSDKDFINHQSETPDGKKCPKSFDRNIIHKYLGIPFAFDFDEKKYSVQEIIDLIKRLKDYSFDGVIVGMKKKDDDNFEIVLGNIISKDHNDIRTSENTITLPKEKLVEFLNNFFGNFGIRKKNKPRLIPTDENIYLYVKQEFKEISDIEKVYLNKENDKEDEVK